jgi:uncharacterized protein YgbK (DUF1537 family)
MTERSTVSEAVNETELLRGLPPEHAISDAKLAAAVASGRRLVILDDDPTGTQTIADLPVLTRWTEDDLRWAIDQATTAFFVLTNTRSLSPADAAARDREVAEVALKVADERGVKLAFASRSDSTLRGHFPLETDVISAVCAEAGQPIDGVIVNPAYLDAGRLTVDATHWVRTSEGLIPAATSDFAADATFGYANSRLDAWVEEKTCGRIAAGDVVRITIDDLRTGGPNAVRSLLDSLEGGRVAVVDAASENDLRVLTLAIIDAEAGGKRFVYRVGPSFVRSRSGQAKREPIDAARLESLRGESRPQKGGLVVVGSHVPLTTRQLGRLTESLPTTTIELDVPTLIGTTDPSGYRDSLAKKATAALSRGGGTVVISTTRQVVTADTGDESLAISRAVSSAIVDIVRAVVVASDPAFVIAKGGITSSDVATESLGIVRAWVRGTLLPGIVSLWQPTSGAAQGVPYVVFAGNVGDDESLRAVVERLSS